MQVKQIYDIVNDITKTILGEQAVLQEDLGNIVDIGTEIFNANAVDNYVRSLMDHIGRMVFVNRPYSGSAPSVLMDSWEFGSIKEKISAELPDATENESWELEGGTSYDPNIFYKPVVSAKFFNHKTTFEVPMSFTEKQVKESFSSAGQLNAFMSMLYNEVDKSMTIKVDGLVMRTINNMIAETAYADYQGANFNSKSGVRAVNLLYQYNQRFNKSLTADAAITDPDFIRFAAMQMNLYKDRMAIASTLFNVGGKKRFTPADLLHVVMLSEFSNAADIYLQSSTFHDEYTKLVNAERVPYWQGSGTDYSFSSTSKINVVDSDNHSVELGGILGIMFDRDALGVTNIDKRVTSNYNPKAEFYTNWYKFDAGYFNDLNENFVVFFVA